MVEPLFPNFRVSRDGAFNNLTVDSVNLPSSEYTDEGKLLVISRNISQAQPIKLTFTNPDYIFSGTGRIRHSREQKNRIRVSSAFN